MKPGRRSYDVAILQRLRLIRLLGDSGFPLGEVRLLVSDLSPGREDSRELGRRKLVEIDEGIRRLEMTRAVVAWGLRCQCPTFDACSCEIHDDTPASVSEHFRVAPDLARTRTVSR